MIKSALQSSLTNDIKYRSMSAGAVPSSEYLITTTVLTQNEPSVTFNVSSFNGVYRHLQICWTARTTRTSDVDEDILVRLNADSGSNYARHWLRGTGSTVTSNAQTSQTAMWSGWAASSTAASNIFGASVVDILDPFESSKNTTVRTLNGGAGFGVGLISSFWNNTASVTSISLIPGTGANFVAGSRFSLYGVTA